MTATFRRIPSMSRITARLAVLAASILLVMGGCSPGEDTPRGTSPATPSVAEETPSEGDLGPGDVLFEDDFSDCSKGWPEGSPPGERGQGIVLACRNGGYEVSAKPQAKAAFLLPMPSDFGSNHVIIEADVIHSGNRAIYGLFCKSDEEQEAQYVFSLDSTGTWTVGRINGRDLEPLGNGTSESFEPGTGSLNHLEVRCFERVPAPEVVTQLEMAINGTTVFDEFFDDPGLGGRSNSLNGIYFESDFEGDARVLFDNIVVTGVDPDALPYLGAQAAHAS